ncbi:MAG: PucR family transcriptional regulator [Oscillospiraceae bacterium]|jgi:sugar diacid utilization regulator
MNEEFTEKLTLLCDIADANSLQEIADISYRLFGNPIFIQDMAHTTLAYTKCVEINEEHWQKRIVHGKLERNTLKQIMEVKEIHTKSTESRMPHLVLDREVPYERMVKTLISNNRPIGVIVLSAIFKPLTETDMQLLELLSVFVTQRTQRERYLFSPNEKAVENFIIKLLDGEEFTSEQVRSRLDILDWHPLPYIYVIAMCPDKKVDESEDLNLLLSQLSTVPFSRAFIYEKFIIFIFSRKTPVSNWYSDVPELCKNIADWSMLAGVSRVFQDLTYVRKHYLEAMTALRLGAGMDKRLNIYSYNVFTVYHLMENLRPDVEPRSFCHEKILKLEQYDKSEDAELLSTLQVYLEHAKSLSKTAEILFIHRNTVRYRINKCKEIMQTDLSDGNEIFSFILSLQILEYERKIKRAKLI